MELIIAGVPQSFMGIKAFRDRYSLPNDFCMSYFEAKDTTGMASMNDAGDALNHLEQALLGTVPHQYEVMNLLTICDELEDVFYKSLIGINHRIGLREPEVDYAVAGFADVLRRWSYQAIQSNVNRQSAPDFKQIYSAWLNESIRIASRIFDYMHQGQPWQVQIVNHAYGRIGLQVDTGSEVHYVADHTHACPAEGFMYRLLQAITDALNERRAQS